MTTFARIIDGFAVDVCVTPPSLEDRFHPEWLARQTFVIVSGVDIDGNPLQSGATTQDGGLSFKNPPPPAVIPTVPVLLSKTAFQDLAWSRLAGGGAAGMARFNVILTACRTGDDVLQAIYDRYTAAVTFALDQVTQLTSIMVAKAVMTAAEQTNILSHWPQQQG